MRYPSLSAMLANYRKGFVSFGDGDGAFVDSGKTFIVSDSDPEGEVSYEANTEQLLKEALELLGIPIVPI